MHLKYIITGVNENERYLKCVPFFIDAWKACNKDLQVIVVLFAHKLPDSLRSYEEQIHLIPPIDKVSTAFCSQVVRLLYPCILPNDGAALISDVDLLPLNYEYFDKAMRKCSPEKFVTFRSDHMKKHKRPEIVMCYNAALPSVWKDVFGIKDYDSMLKKMSSIYAKVDYEDIHNGKGWRTDQRMLYQVLNHWGSKETSHVEYTDHELGFARMNPSEIDITTACTLIKERRFVDIHINKEIMFSSDKDQGISYQKRILSYIKSIKETTTSSA